MSRARAAGLIGSVAVVVVGLATGAVLVRRSDSTAPTSEASVATVRVERTNLVATERLNGTLGYAELPPIVLQRGGTSTSLPDEGSVIQPGQPLLAVDERPVVLLSGTSPAFRDIGPGVTDGADIEQLEASLAALGYDPSSQMTVDQHFTSATALAVRRFQAALGVTPTGVVRLGDVVFEPGPVRVGSRRAELGARVTPGEQPYAATSPSRVVSIALDAGRQRGIDVGVPVTIDLLTGATTPGAVEAVGRVASSAPASNGSPGPPTVALTIAVDDPSTVGSLDQIPVQVEIPTASRTNVLAVPVTALLALAEGGDGLEVVEPDGRHRFVAVTTGLFTNTLVEITSGDVAEGTTIVTAR